MRLECVDIKINSSGGCNIVVSYILVYLCEFLGQHFFKLSILNGDGRKLAKICLSDQRVFAW